MGVLPKTVVKRLLTEKGGGMRVSSTALERAVDAAEDYIAQLAQEAQALAESDRRKTIMDQDIDGAREKLR